MKYLVIKFGKVGCDPKTFVPFSVILEMAPSNIVLKLEIWGPPSFWKFSRPELKWVSVIEEISRNSVYLAYCGLCI